MKIPFAISARTARLIGMENFANAEGAVVELVKNAYDADADTCIVVADIRENRSESKLFIIDNGSGMTDDVIIKHWMTIGTDDKLINTRSSKKKRIKSGAKGIGQRGIQPENLPVAEDIKKVERRVASNIKKIEKTTKKLPKSES